MLLRRLVVCAVMALSLLSWACGKKKEAPQAPAGPSSPGTVGTSSAPPVAAAGGLSPESTSTAGLPNGLRVTATPQGGSPTTSVIPNLDIACGRPTPADAGPTTRKFETLLVVEAPGVHTFALMTDDGAVLSVGGTEVGRSPSLRDTKVPVNFAKPGVYRLTLELTNELGPYCADIRMAEAGSESLAPLPAARLFVPR